MKLTIPHAAGIYLITSTVNGHRYVGSGVDLYFRRANHLYYLRKGKHHNPHLQAAYHKYGESAFEFSVLELLAEGQSLVSAEQRWLDELDAAARPDFYNFCARAYSHLGRKRSEETKRRLSEAHRGKKASAETREKQRQRKLGRKQSAEHIRNSANARRGMKISRPKGILGLSIRKFTAEQVRAMRADKATCSYSTIMKRYGVSLGGLMKIINRQTYQEVA